MNIQKLRDKIRQRTEELNIRPAHDETGHWYLFGDKKYSSVTAHLQVLKDPGLANWKLSRAMEALAQSLAPNETWMREEIYRQMEQAKLAPQLEFEGAGDIGTQVHTWREEKFRAFIGGYFTTWETPDTFDSLAVTSATRAIKKFVSDHNYIPLACELYLADHKLRIGGTLDDIGIIGDSLVLIDLKTSNIGNKDSYYAQICLYLKMFRRLYRLYPKKVYILHVSKENGTYKLIPLHDRIDINATIQWAEKVVAVSQGLEIVRETKKVKPVIL